MKIWYLPPKYIDNKSLVSEYDHLTMFLEVLNPNKEWAGFYFLRLKMIERELKSRSIRFVSIDLNQYDYRLQRSPDQEELAIAKRNLLDLWEYRLVEPEIIKRLDLLSQTNPEELYVESEFMIEQFRMEYGL